MDLYCALYSWLMVVILHNHPIEQGSNHYNYEFKMLVQYHSWANDPVINIYIFSQLPKCRVREIVKCEESPHGK